MKITFYGHACIEIKTNDVSILVDPFISANERAKDIDIDALNPDYILLTHAHQDHVLDVERIARNSGAKLISNFEIISYYQAKGIDGHGMNTGGGFNFEFGRVTSTLAHHSSMFADGTYGGNPNGYILNLAGKQIYIAGDTSLTYDMKLIPELYGKLDLAVLPIGDNFTMGPKEAVKAAEFVQCNNILGYHYDTFGYIEINHEVTKTLFQANNIQLHLLEIGKSLEL